MVFGFCLRTARTIKIAVKTRFITVEVAFVLFNLAVKVCLRPIAEKSSSHHTYYTPATVAIVAVAAIAIVIFVRRRK